MPHLWVPRRRPATSSFANGKVVDGSGNAWSYGDVAVIGDRIAAIGQIVGEAKRVIDATGLVVAPGFIDVHSHSDWVLFERSHGEIPGPDP